MDEQIATIRNTRFLAGIIGTLGHNMLFARPNQNMLLINKTYNVNVAQMDINQIKKINMTYIDSYLAEFPTLIGNGPFFLIYSQMLKKYVEEQVNTGREKKFTEKFVPICKYIYCPVCLLVLILGILLGGIG